MGLGYVGRSVFIALRGYAIFRKFAPRRVERTLSVMDCQVIRLTTERACILTKVPYECTSVVIRKRVVTHVSKLSNGRTRVSELKRSVLVTPTCVFTRGGRVPMDIRADEGAALLHVEPSRLGLLVSASRHVH